MEFEFYSHSLARKTQLTHSHKKNVSESEYTSEKEQKYVLFCS
jgi:hypothetical protein